MNTVLVLNPKDTFQRLQKTDGYFNATHFLTFYNQSVPFSERKDMGDFKVLKSTKEFINFLQEKENIDNPIKSSKKGTWMHPKVFIDFAMWLSLEFKSMAIDWVLDGLIKERNEAGDHYKELVSAIVERHISYYNCKPMPMVYINEANMLKSLANINDRNTANEKQLSVLNTLQLVDINLIKRGVNKDSRKRHLEITAESINV